jgi:hypothetical protein
MRDMGNDVHEFTLPESGGAYGQDNFELCKEIPCSGQYSAHWLKTALVFGERNTVFCLENFRI